MARKRVLNAADWRGPSGVKAVCAALARYQNCPSPPLTTNASWLPGATSGQIPCSMRSQASLRGSCCRMPCACHWSRVASTSASRSMSRR